MPEATKPKRFWEIARKDGRRYVLLTHEGGNPVGVSWWRGLDTARRIADRWAARQHRSAELWDIAEQRLVYRVAWDVRPRFVVPPVLWDGWDAGAWFPSHIHTVPI